MGSSFRSTISSTAVSAAPYFVHLLLLCPASRFSFKLRDAVRLFPLLIPLFVLSGCELIPQHINARSPKTTIAPAKAAKSRRAALRPIAGVPTTELPQDKPRPQNLPVHGVSAFKAHMGGINALVATPDGRRLFSGGDDGQVLLSEVSGGEDSRMVTMETIFEGTKPILALALSPLGDKLAVAQTSFIAVLDIPSRNLERQLSRIRGRVTSLAFDPRGELIAFGMATGDIYVWSLQSGLFSSGGKNSLDSLEHYMGGVSPVVSLIFHPSGRAFFAAEQEGIVSMWRLLRTEEEMGLRDDFALTDQKHETSDRLLIGSLTVKLNEIALSADEKLIHVAAENGSVYSWKIRGLVKQRELNLGTDQLFTVAGAQMVRTHNGEAEMVLASGRGQWLRFICRAASANTTEAEMKLVSQMGLFPKPINKIRLVANAPVFWGAEKSDNLLIFESSLLSEPIGDCQRRF